MEIFNLHSVNKKVIVLEYLTAIFREMQIFQGGV